MAAGYVHGVLNTDNMNITGESFDFGPWRFAPDLDPDFTAARANLSWLYNASARNADAERVLVEGLKRQPEIGELQYSLGLLLAEEQRLPEAAEALKLCAPDLVKMGLVDGVIPEPAGGAHCNPEQAADNIRATIEKELQILSKTPIEKLLTSRYEKFRRMGVFEE
jgi:tetratricopeptide (TPR) repeat protein